MPKPRGAVRPDHANLRRTRIAVPERVSALGFDDRPPADWFDLSTVARSPSAMARPAGEPALKLIDDSDGDQERHIVLPTHVIPRGTTAPVAARTTADAATAAARGDQSASSASE
ncbi:substrate-binding domain-containing protein [Streptomyces massasporeus]|uniref:substrate-binding domain-containing protein n=1 Tax=Streptomyces massasporeus TaxID=67324 RepID=UPI003711D2DB